MSRGFGECRICGVRTASLVLPRWGWIETGHETYTYKMTAPRRKTAHVLMDRPGNRIDMFWVGRRDLRDEALERDVSRSRV